MHGMKRGNKKGRELEGMEPIRKERTKERCNTTQEEKSK